MPIESTEDHSVIRLHDYTPEEFAEVKEKMQFLTWMQQAGALVATPYELRMIVKRWMQLKRRQAQQEETQTPGV